MLFLPGLELNAVCWGPQLMKKITKDGKGSSSLPSKRCGQIAHWGRSWQFYKIACGRLSGTPLTCKSTCWVEVWDFQRCNWRWDRKDKSSIVKKGAMAALCSWGKPVASEEASWGGKANAEMSSDWLVGLPTGKILRKTVPNFVRELTRDYPGTSPCSLNQRAYLWQKSAKQNRTKCDET